MVRPGDCGDIRFGPYGCEFPRGHDGPHGHVGPNGKHFPDLLPEPAGIFVDGVDEHGYQVRAMLVE